MPCQLDVHYGSHASEKLDIFGSAAARPAPVLVYIHGGYWRALDKQDQSFVVAAFVAAGAVAAPRCRPAARAVAQLRQPPAAYQGRR